MDLTLEETRIILEALRAKYGPGYAPGEIGKLQAKLSINLEVKSRLSVPMSSYRDDRTAADCSDCKPGRPCYGHGHGH